MTRWEMLKLVRKVIAKMYEHELVNTKTASKMAQRVNKWQEVKR